MSKVISNKATLIFIDLGGKIPRSKKFKLFFLGIVATIFYHFFERIF